MVLLSKIYFLPAIDGLVIQHLCYVADSMSQNRIKLQCTTSKHMKSKCCLTFNQRTDKMFQSELQFF